MVPIQILFGSQSGNAQNLASIIGESLDALGFSTKVVDMGDCDPEEILNMTHILIVTSTYGDGEAPDNASAWLSYLKFSDDLNLDHIRYAVLGLGDTYYPHFCQAARDFDEYLSKRGAYCLQKRLECDLYYEEQYPDWFNAFIQVLKKSVHE